MVGGIVPSEGVFIAQVQASYFPMRRANVSFILLSYYK